LKAIVIGAGVGGLSAGLALRRVGVEVGLFERRRDVASLEAGTGLTLWPNAMVSLRKLGVGDEIEAGGSALELLEQRTWRWRELRSFDVGGLSRRGAPPTVNVSRAHLTGTLLGRLGETAPRTGRACAGFAQDDDAVTAAFEDGTQETGDLLIGADGSTPRCARSCSGRRDLGTRATPPGVASSGSTTNARHEVCSCS